MSASESHLYIIPWDENGNRIYLQEAQDGMIIYLRPFRFPRFEADRIMGEILRCTGIYVNSIEIGCNLVFFTNHTSYIADLHAVPKHVVSYMVQLGDEGISVTLGEMLHAIDQNAELHQKVYFRLDLHDPDVMKKVVLDFKRRFQRSTSEPAGAAHPSARGEGEGGDWVKVKRPNDGSQTLNEKLSRFVNEKDWHQDLKKFLTFLKNEVLDTLEIPDKVDKQTIKCALADILEKDKSIAKLSAWKTIKRHF